MGPVIPFTSTHHPPLTAVGYICYLLLASLFLLPSSHPPETEPHSFSSCVTQLWTWDKWKGSLFFFFLSSFVKWKWHQVVTQSFSLSFWGREVLFLMILFFIDAALALIFYFFLKGGLVTRGKNLKDRRCWFIVGWLCFFFPSPILNFSFVFC